MISERELRELQGISGVLGNLRMVAGYFSLLLGRTVSLEEASDAINRLNAIYERQA